MGLYGKKLHIKKSNGVVQIANLYTDKSDVGNNYLTFRDGSNTIYSVLDVNSDIDCKISKNNVNYKIKKEVLVMPNYIVIHMSAYPTFTAPNGVNVIFAVFGWDTDLEQSAEEYLKERLKTNEGDYIKVTPNKRYLVYNRFQTSKESVNDYEEFYKIGNWHYETIHGYGVSNDPDYYDESTPPIIIAWSSEINSHATNLSAD